MKKLIVLLSILIASYTIHAQDPRDGLHIFNYQVSLQPCDAAGTATGAANETIDAEVKFHIITTVGNSYVISILRFTGTNSRSKNSRLVSTGGNPIYFLLLQAQYALDAERLQKKGNFTIGAATTLIKVRPGRKDPKDGYNIYSEFGNDFNIGVSAGWKIEPNRKKPISHSIVGGLSFSSIKVTPYTTKEYITSESTQGCITLSAGYVFEYNKFQVSIFSGIDIMSGEIGRSWIYRNRPWLGLGFGFQIFRAEGKTEN